ncbi:helix-turn-helix transcriptional regulator [Reinekea blandensis]|uniref:HTH araC/xylS-type domain-containing protein n=1 Tax=Reinekea blandensis MED297 TaxID=314283 RepID=A4BJM9_9GAMM|nr:AraC family transcriptional regulator [Reinekea blandensis]EAR07669.1 hypothetical protein MED297_06504 [Reinekea sp. MED297] [Reinekea blandensis MED297]
MLNHLLISSDVSALLADFIDGWTEAENRPMTVQSRAMLQQAVAPLAAGARLSYEQWWMVLEELAQLTGQPALGLSIGQYVKVEHFGCLGYLFKTSLNVEQALRCFERFQRLLYDGNRASLIIEAGPSGEREARLVWASEYGYSHALSDEVLISGLLHLLQTLLADDQLRPTRIEFTHTVAAEVLADYDRCFQCEITGNRPNLCVVFPAEVFSRPIIGGDEHLHQLISHQAESLLSDVPHADAEEKISLRARKALIRALQEGCPTADVIAEQLHLSKRTLHRRLHDEGVVFRDLLRETRMTLAEQYLKDGKMTLPEVALMLGYSEQSAFNRAFRQWFAVSPRQYHRLHQG